MMPAPSAVIGIVIIQATAIFCAVLQRTEENRLAEPTPIIEEEMTWVVLTGNFNKVATIMIVADEKSAAKPLAGSSFMIRVPIVLIILHPPIDVPKAIAKAQEIFTHRGTSRLAWKPPATRAKVMIPIDFWASLVPWLKACQAAVKI